MAVSLYEFKFKGSCVLYGGGVEDQPWWYRCTSSTSKVAVYFTGRGGE